MTWQPRDVLNLVAMIGALILFFIGAFMVWQGVAAEGTIDIKSTFVSGSLKTGSAGLFIVFLAFFLASFALFSANSDFKKQASSTASRPSRGARLAKGFFALVGACFAATALAAAGYATFFGPLAGLLGFSALMCGFAYITMIEHE